MPPSILRWLERFLKSWKSELIVISHDREFMDSITTHSMLIRRCGLRKIEGGTAKLYEQVAQEEEVYEQTRLNSEAKKRDMEVFINRFRAKASKASLVQSRIKALDRLGQADKLEAEDELDFEFRCQPFPGKQILEVQELSFDYSGAADRGVSPLINRLSFEIRKTDRIAVIGKNGRGKSTLLRLLAGELEPQSGTLRRSPNAAVGYFGQTNIQRLSPGLTVEEEIFGVNNSLSRTQVRNICGTMMFDGDKALKKIEVLSGGEKSRVLLGMLLARPSNLLLLDEPTNHLDMESVESMIESLEDYEGAIVIVTHNERILRALATRLIVFQGNGQQLLEGSYDYFLEKIGWEQEREDRPSAGDSRQARGGEDRPPAAARKRERAELIQARSRALKPLEKKIKEIEDRICALEESVKAGDRELIEAARLSDGPRIADLGRELTRARAEIEQQFVELEQVVLNHQKLSEEFEARLRSLAD